MELVVNEWFLDWHSPNASMEEQKHAGLFLKCLLENDHKLVLLRESPFMQKLHTYRKAFDFYIPARLSLKTFFSNILNNSDKCRIVENALPLPAELEDKLSQGNFSSDRYLFESAQETEQKIIVTTDQRLIAHIGQTDNFRLITFEDFFQNHCPKPETS
ncbi:MAG: hypothetical protein JNJ90_15950 [Saprospiraceae bacterium]|jgi:hypothetical protein|nr:hypothetical protein [Saprospiraceae bacterium]